MIAMQVARLIANIYLFLELTDEENLNLDASVDMMEDLAGHLEEFDKGFLRELVDAFAVIAPEFSGEQEKMVRDIPHYLYLEEVLAADDPARLAELEALRDARD